MEHTIVEVKSNFGNDKVKMKIFSQSILTNTEKEYIATLKRDELIKYGNIKKWTVIDISEW